MSLSVTTVSVVTIIDSHPTRFETARRRGTADRPPPPSGPGAPAGSAGPTSATGSAHRFGRFGEDCAAEWYRQNGYRILSRNWRCVRGELDLVVSRGSLVAFVEVKARSSRRFGSGAEAVDWRKQTRIRSLASQWLEENGSYVAELRFDVIDVDGRGGLEVFLDCF